VHITAQGPRLRNDLYCVEWDVKLYYTIPYHTIPFSEMTSLIRRLPISFCNKDKPDRRFEAAAHNLDVLFTQRPFYTTFNISSFP